MEDKYHIEDSLSSCNKEQEEEEHAPSFQEDTKKAIEKSDLTLPYHHVIHVTSIISCHVMSHHLPHHSWIM